MSKLKIERIKDNYNVETEGNLTELSVMMSDIMFQNEAFALMIETAFNNYLANGGEQQISPADLELAKKQVRNNKLMN